jgi:hypothetical protein
MLTLDSDPVLNPVSLGAELLNFMAKSDYSEFETESLYVMTEERFRLSYDVFAYTLDWLFLVGAIDMDGQGFIRYAP